VQRLAAMMGGRNADTDLEEQLEREQSSLPEPRRHISVKDRHGRAAM